MIRRDPIPVRASPRRAARWHIGRSVRPLDAVSGERLGLAHCVVDKGKSLEKAIEIAEVIAANAVIPNCMIIQALPRIADMSAADGLWTESIAQALSLTSGEARAAMDAFLDRRKIDS